MIIEGNCRFFDYQKVNNHRDGAKEWADTALPRRHHAFDTKIAKLGLERHEEDERNGPLLGVVVEVYLCIAENLQDRAMTLPTLHRPAFQLLPIPSQSTYWQSINSIQKSGPVSIEGFMPGTEAPP